MPQFRVPRQQLDFDILPDKQPTILKKTNDNKRNLLSLQQMGRTLAIWNKLPREREEINVRAGGKLRANGKK